MTVTTADALAVLKHVAACHRKTAPKLDDRQAALATAGIWAELFNAHRLELPDLLAAVKMRAQHEAEAPEPADVIQFARKIRKDRDAAAGPSPEYEALCESKAADAAELAELRRRRALEPVKERPALHPALRQIAGRKAVD